MQPDFPAAVQAVAEQDAGAPHLPDLDLTHLEFVTIDPAGAMDLDQAMHLEADGDGYVVHYAIADVHAFVAPGDAVDVEAHARGESLYGANSKIPLHPPVLSEGAASLLPDEDRPAFVWTIALDADGDVTRREGGASPGALAAEARLRRRAARAGPGAVRARRWPCWRSWASCGSRRRPSAAGSRCRCRRRRSTLDGDRLRLEYRAMLPVENWNAQLSLLTGFAAAKLMIDGKVGVLRTLPPAPEHEVRASASYGARTRDRLAQQHGSPRVHPVARPVASGRCRHGRGVHEAAAGSRVRRLRRAGPRAAASTQHWPRRTPMSRRRCVGWSTATDSRSARPSAPGRRSRRGCATAWTRCRT